MASRVHMLKGFCKFMGGSPSRRGESPPCHIWWPLVWCKWRLKVFNMSRDLYYSGSRDISNFFVTWPWKTTWSKGHVILWMRTSHGKSPPFGGDRSCGSVDKMLLVVEGQDSTCPRFNPPLLIISKAHGMSCSHSRNFRT